MNYDTSIYFKTRIYTCVCIMWDTPIRVLCTFREVSTVLETHMVIMKYFDDLDEDKLLMILVSYYNVIRSFFVGLTPKLQIIIN